MSETAIAFNQVYKKFKKGEIYDSLRDLIPGLAKRLFVGRNGNADSLGSKEFWSLRDVSFEIKKGESFGIIGHNGAGKSTILKLLSGIMKPTRGSLEVHGRLSALIEVGAGFHPDLTGRENIFLNGIILGMSKGEIRRKFDEIVEFSGLEEFIDTPVKRYSSGMYARLGFSVAAHLEPDILVIDEVLSVGDLVFQKQCAEKMKSIFRGGATLIFVSHNLRAVTDLCQRCILLDHGKLIQDGPAVEVTQYYMNPGQGAKEAHVGKEAYISSVTLRGENGGGFLFDTGDKVFLEVEVTGIASCEKLSVTAYFADNDYNCVFASSTQELNKTTFSLGPGEKKKVIFELNLHLGPGTYHVSTFVYRFDLQKLYDSQDPAIALQIRSNTDIRGVANLYPKAAIE
jgi:lipopolysaccharide transport system ATP-binding protein